MGNNVRHLDAARHSDRRNVLDWGSIGPKGWSPASILACTRSA